jgi:hypothetical protein
MADRRGQRRGRAVANGNEVAAGGFDPPEQRPNVRIVGQPEHCPVAAGKEQRHVRRVVVEHTVGEQIPQRQWLIECGSMVREESEHRLVLARCRPFLDDRRRSSRCDDVEAETSRGEMHERDSRLLGVLPGREQVSVGHLEVALLGAQHEDLLLAVVRPAAVVDRLVVGLLRHSEQPAQRGRDVATAGLLRGGRHAEQSLDRIHVEVLLTRGRSAASRSVSDRV